MMDALKSMPGPQTCLGLGLYAGICWLAAGPIGERIAVRDHLSRCVAGLSETVSDAAASMDPRQQLAIDLAQEFGGQLPGPLGETLRDLLNSAERLAENRRRKAAEADARKSPDRCQCRMRMALSMTRMDFALWVGTLKLHQPASVRDFGSVMATVDRNNVCGGQS
jgi:hypothetical protein